MLQVLAEFPGQVSGLVSEHHDVLFPEVRRCLVQVIITLYALIFARRLQNLLVQALILLRNRKLVDAVAHMKLMFMVRAGAVCELPAHCTAKSCEYFCYFSCSGARISCFGSLCFHTLCLISRTSTACTRITR